MFVYFRHCNKILSYEFECNVVREYIFGNVEECLLKKKLNVTAVKICEL